MYQGKKKKNSHHFKGAQQQFAERQRNNNVGAYYLETDVHPCTSCYKSQKENRRPASKSLQLPTSITLLTQVIVNRVGLLGEEE